MAWSRGSEHYPGASDFHQGGPGGPYPAPQGEEYGGPGPQPGWPAGQPVPHGAHAYGPEPARFPPGPGGGAGAVEMAAAQGLPPPPPGPVPVASGLGLLSKSGWVFQNIDLTLRSASVAAIEGPAGTGRSACCSPSPGSCVRTLERCRSPVTR